MKTLSFLLLSLLASVRSWTPEVCDLSGLNDTHGSQREMVTINVTETYLVIELDHSTGAKALDGSKYKFYITPGNGTGADKFVIFWEGGAYCGNEGESVLQSCYGKLNGRYGTSTAYPDNNTWTNSNHAEGAFSSQQEYNPMFWNWNKVKIIPLDGANFQGSLDEPLVYNNTNIWFRGFNNTFSTFEYLRDHFDLFNASEILLGGGSAGGIAAMQWSQFLKDWLPKNIRISIFGDGAMFLDAYNKHTGCFLFRYMMQQLVDALSLNSSANNILYRNCKYRNTATWKCLMMKYIYEDIEYAGFLSNSQTDASELTELMSISCLNEGGPDFCDNDERKEITTVREDFLRFALKIKKAKPTWGFFLRSCFEHSLQFVWAWYGESMDVYNAESQEMSSLRNALYNMYSQKTSSNSYIDLIDWLHNPRCVYLVE